MSKSATDTEQGEVITVRVPLAIRKRGGRKLLVAPAGEPESARTQIDNALVKALARAHRWKRMLESGEYGSLTELAQAEKINRSYLGRVLRLTLLAPDVVEAIFDGRQEKEVTLPALMEPFPIKWDGQASFFARVVDREIVEAGAKPHRPACR
jgi:hypothetical protein